MYFLMFICELKNIYIFDYVQDQCSQKNVSPDYILSIQYQTVNIF